MRQPPDNLLGSRRIPSDRLPIFWERSKSCSKSGGAYDRLRRTVIMGYLLRISLPRPNRGPLVGTVLAQDPFWVSPRWSGL